LTHIHKHIRRVLAAGITSALLTGVAVVPATAGVDGFETIVAGASTGYRYQQVTEGTGVEFEDPAFDDTAFATGGGVFGTAGGCGWWDENLNTPWVPQTDLLVRRTIAVPDDGRQLHLAVAVVGAAQVFVNGIDVSGGLVVGSEWDCPSRDNVHVKVPESALQRGEDNLIAIRARATPSAAYFDMQAILVPVPSNDNVVNARDASSTPFTDELSFMGASLEPEEPQEVCPAQQCTSAWYSLTVTETTRLVLQAVIPADEEDYPLGIAVYTGEPFAGLVPVVARGDWEWRPLLLQAAPDTRYLVQVTGTERLTWYGGEAVVTAAVAPEPTIELDVFPTDAVTTATEVRFWANVQDPAGQSVASVDWDFGDDTTGQGDSVSHYFKRAGTYSVAATARMADGRTATASATVEVATFEGPPPTASFTWTPEAPDHLTDVGFSTTANDPALVGIERYDWDFGDGTSGAGAETSHRFAAGTWPVTLRVETFDGRTTSVVHELTVTERELPDPVAYYWMWPPEPYVNQHAWLCDASSDPGGVGIAGWSWNFGDGSSGTGACIDHAWAAPGSYTIELTVTTWDGRTASTSAPVTVTTPPPPQVGIWAGPSEPSRFDTVQFGSYVWDLADRGITGHAWDFGDGTTSTDANPTHRFTSDGTYQVSLTVTLEDETTASTTYQIQVATHDVAILKLLAARSASMGQTKSITADISSRNGTETVTVVLYRGTPQGFEFVAEKHVTVKAGKTVRVTFNYRFTAADASIGSITFKVAASPDGVRDALPADNEAMTSPTKVTK
jgi:PKD repeat protein